MSGITFAMPASYGQRIKAVPGVVAVTPMNWFGGYWKDPANTFANFAVDANTVFDVVDIAESLPTNWRPSNASAWRRWPAVS